ncbi:hypothetical protein EVA_14659 [gut metagenome]|uniref:Uncharacterized protein n=1 Tax=gut metagenome TaxID=749906 RepID=J9G610_9ZZZZ
MRNQAGTGRTRESCRQVIGQAQYTVTRAIPRTPIGIPILLVR